MPNWVENDLTVSGETAEVMRFLEFAKSEDRLLDFEQFVPYPQTYEEQDEEYAKWYSEQKAKAESGEKVDWTKQPKDGYNSGGYMWCVNNWGTKWNACRAVIGDLDENESSVLIEFDTAWSPPLPIIRKMAELFPSLSFDLRYFEGGMGFNGILQINKGETSYDETGAYFGNRGG